VLAARTVGQYIYASRAQYTSTCTKAVTVEVGYRVQIAKLA